MGYTTIFRGKITTENEIKKELREYLDRFLTIRHVTRDVERIKLVYPDWEKYTYNGKLGTNGEFFATPMLMPEECFTESLFSKPLKNYLNQKAPEGYVFNPVGQDEDDSVIDNDRPAGRCPGLWCDWRLKGQDIEWSGAEKFYSYVDWLEYILDNFMTPNGIYYSGEIEWQGEDEEDRGIIKVRKNIVLLEALQNDD